MLTFWLRDSKVIVGYVNITFKLGYCRRESVKKVMIFTELFTGRTT